jgi:TPR repeat protein
MCVLSRGESVEKDMKKEMYHLEEAAIGGHPEARYNIGARDWNNGRYERAVKQWIIVANLGHYAALDRVKKGFTQGDVSKDDFEAALRGHQAAVDATKSTQRDAAEKI